MNSKPLALAAQTSPRRSQAQPTEQPCTATDRPASNCAKSFLANGRVGRAAANPESEASLDFFKTGGTCFFGPPDPATLLRFATGPSVQKIEQSHSIPCISTPFWSCVCARPYYGRTRVLPVSIFRLLGVYLFARSLHTCTVLNVGEFWRPWNSEHGFPNHSMDTERKVMPPGLAETFDEFSASSFPSL